MDHNIAELFSVLNNNWIHFWKTYRL